MKLLFAEWSLILLCLSMAAAIGGGFYESLVLLPQWSKSPPASLAIMQPGTGVPPQRFWIPVHIAITIFAIAALAGAWSELAVRTPLLIGLGSYVVMRAWSGFYFIPEALAFQRVPRDSAPTPELTARVQRWGFWTWFREPLDVISFVSFLLALQRLKV